MVFSWNLIQTLGSCKKALCILGFKKKAGKTFVISRTHVTLELQDSNCPTVTL